jgi:hypothetical protein
MIKVFLILASAVLLGGAALGWMNREEFIQVRTDKDTNNSSIKTKVKATDKEITKLRDELYVALDKTHAEFDEAELGTERYARNIVEQDRLLSAAMGKKSKLMEQKSEFDRALEELRLKFPNVTLEELPGRIEEMKKELADAQTSEKELNKNVAAMNKRVAKNNSTIQTFSQRQAKRSQGISLNGTEGTITAVNWDLGFVVINIGKNQGVGADSELIVKRGSEIVGMLTISSIEPRLTVADIRQDSLKKGARIIPGDRVIFEKLQD